MRLQQLLADQELSLAELGRRLGRGSRDSTLGQILNESPDSKTGTPRRMGDAQARAIELEFPLPVGWMDRDPDVDSLESAIAELRSQALAVRESPPRYNAWPFPRLSPERLAALPPDARAQIEDMLLGAVQLAERLAPASHSGKQQASAA